MAPLCARLRGELAARHEGVVNVLLAEKNFETAEGLVLTDEMRLAVAGQAALLQLHEGAEYYPGLASIILYPESFTVRHERWGDATILTAGPVEHQDDETGTETRQIVRVAAYRPGTVELPPVAVHWADETLLSRPQRFEVVFSLTPDELAEGPRPPAPPHRLPPLSPWWSVSGGALALALALIFERRRPPTTAVQPRGSLDATSELLAGLADLERQRPDPVLFHTRLSLGLRRFVGRSVGFDGETATAPGLRRRLDGLDLPRALSSRTGDLLAECDAVRFGGRPASAQDMGRRLATARGLARGWPQRATAAAHRAPRSNQEAES